jgi:tetratricopeptide (TPR) repeat protein
VGSDEIYWNLGLTRLRLGDSAGALEAYAYARHLDPSNPEASFDVASALLAAGREAEAVRPLWQTLLLDAKHVRALTTLAGLYRRLEPGGCAVVEAQGQALPGLDLGCPAVHGDVCAAGEDLARLFQDARRPALAERARREAARTYGCASEEPGK